MLWFDGVRSTDLESSISPVPVSLKSVAVETSRTATVNSCVGTCIARKKLNLEYLDGKHFSEVLRRLVRHFIAAADLVRFEVVQEFHPPLFQLPHHGALEDCELCLGSRH